MPAEAAPSWLFAPELGAAGDELPLSEADRRYLTRICRARPGETATATDGQGAVARLRLDRPGGALVARVESVERRERGREAWLLCGPPEAERGDWLVEKLAELGVAVLQPLDCARGAWPGAARRRARWSRLAIAALRQSRQPFLLEIRDPQPPSRVLSGLPSAGSRWLADPAGPRGRSSSAAESPGIGAVGPAAGFDDEEWSLFRSAGFEPMALSESRLRTETAAMAWASWWASG